jgi:hypothetical protein
MTGGCVVSRVIEILIPRIASPYEPGPMTEKLTRPNTSEAFKSSLFVVKPRSTNSGGLKVCGCQMEDVPLGLPRVHTALERCNVEHLPIVFRGKSPKTTNRKVPS